MIKLPIRMGLLATAHTPHAVAAVLIGEAHVAIEQAHEPRVGGSACHLRRRPIVGRLHIGKRARIQGRSLVGHPVIDEAVPLHFLESRQTPRLPLVFLPERLMACPVLI